MELDATPDGARIERLRASLARHVDADVEVVPFRSGVDCWVDLVKRPRTPDAVVRSAKVERLLTRYDGLVDFGVGVAREVVAARLLREAGVPTPAILAWRRSGDPEREPSWMLTELVPHTEAEDVPPGAHTELGRLARRIHAVEPAGADLDHLSRPEPWGQWILARLLRRLEAARRYMSIPADAQVERALVAALHARAAHARSLLHLDLRAPNLAMRGDRIVSVFDLGNAIVGDRYLELARVRGCGLLTPAFLSGYGEDPAELRRNAPALDAYELDLAALLVVVSREEFDDAILHRTMAARVAALLARLTAG